MALLEGLKLARELSCQDIQVEGDALSLIQCMCILQILAALVM